MKFCDLKLSVKKNAIKIKIVNGGRYGVLNLLKLVV